MKYLLITFDPASTDGALYQIATNRLDDCPPKKFRDLKALRRTLMRFLMKHERDYDAIYNVLAKLTEMAAKGEKAEHKDISPVPSEFLAFLRTPGIAE